MSYHQFLETDFENPHVEWVDGEVVPMPPVSDEHQDVSGFLYVLLRHFVEEHDLGVIRQDPFQMKTGPSLPGRAPDIMFVSRRNLRRLHKTHLEGPADVVVEIISPASVGVDRGDKHYEYERGGVREYWLLDPMRRRAEFYRRDRKGVFRLVPVDSDGIYHSAVLKGFMLRVEWLWQKPLPRVKDILRQLGL